MLQYMVIGGCFKLINFVKKRDGREIPFNEDRITRAIFLAATNVAQKDGIEPDY